ncbi:hypothetical protein HHI36_018028 [Cryptolaemus montrouzieri]|uniref:Uncharacterized protein n=1 Tax=Cryptolaemus montrouzieri TaxID=559131 RepID=A0ABD2NZ22_9CUCU
MKKSEQRKFHSAKKKITKELRPQTVGCKTESGVFIKDEKKTMERWASHFENLMNKQDSSDTITINVQTAADNNIDDEVSTSNEVQNALERLKINRETGENGIYAELLKCGQTSLEKALTYIIKDIWGKECLSVGVRELNAGYLRKEIRLAWKLLWHNSFRYRL